jgi:hypothetical protein
LIAKQVQKDSGTKMHKRLFGMKELARKKMLSDIVQ